MPGDDGVNAIIGPPDILKAFLGVFGEMLCDDMDDGVCKLARVIDRCYERNVVLKFAKGWKGFTAIKFFGYKVHNTVADWTSRLYRILLHILEESQEVTTSHLMSIRGHLYQFLASDAHTEEDEVMVRMYMDGLEVADTYQSFLSQLSEDDVISPVLLSEHSSTGQLTLA